MSETKQFSHELVGNIMEKLKEMLISELYAISTIDIG